MGSIGEIVSGGKKFNTELTDYSTAHADTTGPYAESLEVDALIVGAGFGRSMLALCSVINLTSQPGYFCSKPCAIAG